MQVRKRRKSDGPPVAVFVVIGAAVLGIAAAWWFMQGQGEQGPAILPVPQQAAVAADSGSAGADSVEAIDLPPLDASDEVVRELATGLSAHPRLASWLVTDELADRFVGSVVDLAGGNSPVENVGHLRPEGEFATRQSGSALIIDEGAFRRYDALVETFVSLDTNGTARLYHQLMPLFEEAFADLGIPQWTFDDTFDRAVENLLAVPVPTGPIRVQEDRAVYLFEDEGLETSSAAAKHLIRMGPENQRQFQAKLRELKNRIDALGGGA